MDWRLVGVVALALTAGCAGAFGGEATDEPVTPAPVPDPADAGEETARVAPGVGSDGVTDVVRLARAHQAAVSGTAYVWRYRRYSEPIPANRSVPIERSRELRVESERRYRYHTDSRSTDLHNGRQYFGNFTEYADGERRYRRYVGAAGDGNWTYETEGPAEVSDRYVGEATNAIVRLLAVDAARVSRRDDGTYRVLGVTDAVAGIGPVREYRVRAVVTRAGFVRSVNATFVAPGHQRRYSFVFTYSQVGTTTVEAPSWASDRWAVNETT